MQKARRGFHLPTPICFFNLPTGAGISHRYLVGSKGLSFLTVDAAIVTSMPRFLLFLLRDTKRLDLDLIAAPISRCFCIKAFFT